MSTNKYKRRQTIQPSMAHQLLPPNLLNQKTLSRKTSQKTINSKSSSTSKDKSSQVDKTPIPLPIRKPSNQPRKSIKGTLPGGLFGGDNTNSSVYDKYKQNFAKLLLQGLAGVDNSDKKGEKPKNPKVNELTPMPQLQSKGNNTKVNKDVFAKAERSAVVMRRMEYNAKLAVRKPVRKNTYKGPPVAKIKLIQKMIRGYLIRKKIINKSKYIRKMIMKIRKRNLPKHLKYFIKILKPLPTITEKSFDSISCQTSFIIEREETPKEKYLDLISGGNKLKNGCLHGIKTFPRLKVEIGNNEKLINKMYKRINKIRMDEMQIDTKQKMVFNLNTPQDNNAVQSVIQKLLDFRLDTSSISPANSPRVTDNEISHLITKSNTISRTISNVRSLIKFKVKIETPMFISKKIYTNYQKKIQKRKYMKIKLFLIVLSHLSVEQIRMFVFYIFKKKYYSICRRQKSNFSNFSIEDEVDDFDMKKMQMLKKNVMSEVSLMKNFKTCCTTINKDYSFDNEEEEIDGEFVNCE